MTERNWEAIDNLHKGYRAFYISLKLDERRAILDEGQIDDYEHNPALVCRLHYPWNKRYTHHATLLLQEMLTLPKYRHISLQRAIADWDHLFYEKPNSFYNDYPPHCDHDYFFRQLTERHGLCCLRCNTVHKWERGVGTWFYEDRILRGANDPGYGSALCEACWHDYHMHRMIGILTKNPAGKRKLRQHNPRSWYYDIDRKLAEIRALDFMLATLRDTAAQQSNSHLNSS